MMYYRCFRREGDGLRATTARQHKAIGNVRYYASVVPSSGANSNNNNNKTIGEDISQQKSKIHVDSQGGSRKDESKVRYPTRARDTLPVLEIVMLTLD